MTPFDVELRSVTKRFGDTVAVDGVSLSVERGEFVTLLGPSGCGKTTLLRLIAGFEAPDSGTIQLGGTDVTDLPAYKRDVHTVFQQYALFPHLTVAENVAFGLRRKRVDRATIAASVASALEQVRLPGLDDRMPSQLSGGQQQRVAIARAVVLEPKVLLLDEPLGALDRKLREAMQTELKELQRRLGISFVFVTHDQDEALAMSDRVVVMNAGHVEQLGTPREIYERPSTEFIANFVGVTNVLSGVVSSVDGGISVVEADGGRVLLREGLAVGERVSVAVRPEKIRLVGEAEPNAIRATIEASRYLGDVTNWHVRLDGGQSWIVLAQNDGTESDVATGSRVGLAWDPEHSLRLER
jgi:spermidine/putrescine ABC transporter ATP-binding subunit